MSDYIPENIISQELVKDTQSLNPGSIIEILELDLSEVKFINKIDFSNIDDHYYFHNSSIYGNIVIPWGKENDPTGLGIIYVYPLPFDLSGFSQTNSQLPRPILKISNYKEYLTYLLLQLGNLTGAKIIRHKTMVKYLNNRRVRFGDEIFYVNKKNKETSTEIEFELASPLELEGDKLPKRPIMGDYCTWEYRCRGCAYAGFPICDKNSKFFTTSETPNGYESYNMSGWELNDGHDKEIWDSGMSTVYDYMDYVDLTFKDHHRTYVCINELGSPSGVSIFNENYWVADSCPHKLQSCKQHWGLKAVLPFGGYPATNKYNYDPTTQDLTN